MAVTANYNLNKPGENDFYDINVLNENADIIDEKLKEIEDETQRAKGIPIVTTSGTGVKYTADIDGVTELVDGFKLTIVPHIDCSSGLFKFNEIPVYRRKFENSGEVYEGSKTDIWLKKGVPVTLTFSSKLRVWLTDFAMDTEHTHTVENIVGGNFGGSVKANSDAVSSLNISQLRNIKAGPNDLEAGKSPLATGDIYFVYEE